MFTGVIPFSAEEKTQTENIVEFKDGIRIGTWVGDVKSEAAVELMAKNGVEFVFVWHHDDKAKAVANCEKFGVNCIVMEYSVAVGSTEESVKTFFETCEWVKSPNVIGICIVDEPREDKYDAIAKTVSYMRKYAPHIIPFVNLFPEYAGFADYDAYVRGFIDKIDVDYISTDIYPLYTDTTNPKYLHYVANFGKYARESGRDYWLHIQSMGYTPKNRAPRNSNEVSWQMYIGLSFGVTKFMEFCYKQPGDNGLESFFGASVDRAGNVTEVWNYTNAANEEIKRFSEIIYDYKSLGAFVTEATNRPSKTAINLEESLQYRDFGEFADISSDRSVLVGCFEKESGEKAFILTNLDEILRDRGNTVRFKFDSPKRLKGWISGDVADLSPDADGYYSFTLAAGDGCFLEIEDLEFTAGDVNCNGKAFTFSDTVAAFKAVSGAESVSYEGIYAIDVNGDGNSDIADAREMFMRVSGISK